MISRNGQFKDITDQTFDRLTVKKYVPGPKRAAWLCECKCGKTKVVPGWRLRNGSVTSCGCSHVKHGQVRSPEYTIWNGMIQRCTNPKNKSYPDYGGRGIKVDPRWLDFANFYSDMGQRPGPEYSIDRKENDLGYEPGNCRWATPEEQVNNKRSNRLLTYNGKTQNLKKWSIELGIKHRTIITRLHRGWSVERTLGST